MKQFLTIILIICGIINANAQYREPRRPIEKAYPMDAAFASNRHRVGSVETAPLRCKGTPIVPIILVQFPDLKFTVEETDSLVQSNYDKYFNLTGMPAGQGLTFGSEYGSVSDYYVSQSDSIFAPRFVVIGPVTLKESYKYYGEDSGSNHDIRIDEFYSEACILALRDHNVDWSMFDNNSDGKIDFVFFIYAGHGQNDSAINDTYTIWPKEWAYSKTVKAGDQQITFGGFGCCNELYDNMQDGIGTVVHEMSHGLGLPDFYCTNSSNDIFGLDRLSIMDSGNYQIDGKQPCCMTPYEQEFFAWRHSVELEWGKHYQLTLRPSSMSGEAGVRITNPADPNEYYLLQNRQNLPGTFDQYLGCYSIQEDTKYGSVHGLFVYHVAYSSSAWTSNAVNTVINKQRMTIIPANGNLVPYWSNKPSYRSALRGVAYPGNEDVREQAAFNPYSGGDQFDMLITNITEDEDTHDITLDVYLGKEIITGITSPTNIAPNEAESIYDLSGRTVKENLSSGFYIKNGKKIMVR